ncbi:MAG: MBL fold metallo-hydrolase [Candidatus Thorarchaeota archaeon]
MPISRDLLPNTKNKQIQSLLKQGISDAQDIIAGKGASKETGPFGNPIELMAFELARKSSGDLSSFEIGNQVNEDLSDFFRDVVEIIDPTRFLRCYTLCLYGTLLGNYSDEDFRYLYRYSLRKIRSHQVIEKWLHKAITFLAAAKFEDPKDVMEHIRWWIMYLGAPLPVPSVFQEPCASFGIDIEGLLDTEEYKLVESLRKYPDYFEEAVSGKKFLDLYSATKMWLPDVLSSRFTDIYRKSIYKDAQEKVTADMDVDTAHKKVKKHFKKVGFQSNPDTVLPVRLQELPAPPPADVMDPTAFDLIPQKLRVGLLSSVAYSTKTTKIEVIFLGGQRIGRSGILIKTNSSTILLDYGMSVANQRIPEWVPELDMIDNVLITHSHLDHIGGLPVLYENYTGKWCSTNMCAAITMVLLEDALKVGTPLPPRGNDSLDLLSHFKKKNIEKISKNHVNLDVGKSSEIAPGIVVTPIDADHIPGSVCYLVDIEGKKILYTGDFNIDKSVLFPGAHLPTDSDMVIFDGTYWGREDFDRQQVADTISKAISEKGPVIIPSFAVGRSQEILKILDNMGYTESRNVMVAGMAEKITKLSGVTGSWSGMKKNKVHLDTDDILVAGGGMMGGGLARHHFNEHRDNPDAAVILCGYVAPRTPAWNLLNGYEPHKCHLDYARLSAHSSGSNLEKYIHSCKGTKVIVHTPTEKVPKNLTMPELKSRMVMEP